MATYVDLVMDDGNLVRIEGPSRHEDDIIESINDAMKRRDTWSPARWDGYKAIYLGHRLGHVNMARVIGRM